MSKHTPTPYRVGDAGRTVFGPPNGNPIPETVAHTNRANAAFIVSACNNHDALVAALSMLLEAFATNAPRSDSANDAIKQARSALSAARQTQGEAK